MQTAFACGMTIKEFMDSRPKEVWSFIEARQKHTQFLIEQGWDFVRHIMLYTVAPWQGKNKISLTDIIRLPRDKGQELTPEELEAQLAEAKEWNDKMDKEMIEAGLLQLN